MIETREINVMSNISSEKQQYQLKSFGWEFKEETCSGRGNSNRHFHFTRDTEMKNYKELVELEKSHNELKSQISKTKYYLSGNKIKNSGSCPGLLRGILIVITFLLLCTTTVDRTFLPATIVFTIITVLCFYLSINSKNKVLALYQKCDDLCEAARRYL